MKLSKKFSGLKIVLIVTALAIIVGCKDEANRPADSESKSGALEALCNPNNKSGELALHVPSPDWRDQIIYMLMIDRFNDGDPDNNDQGAGEYDRFKGTHFTGGDIPGIIDKIDYLKDLGATAIWMTPPVYNQWWSREYQATGWHGYWATHFSEVDPHYGTMADYQRLSHELHCNDMYLIQDIVVNHVGNFYDYQGEYDPNDTAKNFFLIEEGHPTQEGPFQYPFSMINRLDPEHAAADIYHWTPPVQDYSDRHQELNYGLGTVADINTENPVVIDAFKKIYGEWIEKVGVDGFRVDTVMLVPPAFFAKFLHDEDGIYPQARELGKDFFITFGEVIGVSGPFETSGEKKVTQYMTDGDRLGLNSMLGYPLYFGISQALAEGRPTKELAFRLDAFMQEYPDPYTTPIFVDNHDTTRFLTSGSQAAFKQALALMMTIPGIPIIFQGTEQALRETRQTMFGPGYGSKEDNFKPDSEYYRYLQALTSLRQSNRVLSRGSMTQLASSATGRGLLAFEREYQGETALVMLNTADHSIFVKDLDTGFAADQKLRTLFNKAFSGDVVTGQNGIITLQLPSRAFVVLSSVGAETVGADNSAEGSGFSIAIDTQLSDKPYDEDILVSGVVSQANADLRLVINGNLDTATAFQADAQGRWNARIPVRAFGEYSSNFQIYAPDYETITDAHTYSTRVTKPDYNLDQPDDPNDAKGPFGTYFPPQQEHADNQTEITGVSVQGAGSGLELTLSIKNLTDVWLPPNGFDNVAFSIFIDLPDRTGIAELPMLNASMPGGLDWDIGQFVTGWNNVMFSAQGSTAEHRGDILGAVPKMTVDKEARTIRMLYNGSPWGVTDWRGARFYITTWDATGEATYVNIVAEPAEWSFSGGKADDPKILDDVLLTVPR